MSFQIFDLYECVLIDSAEIQIERVDPLTLNKKKDIANFDHISSEAHREIEFNL